MSGNAFVAIIQTRVQIAKEPIDSKI